MANKVTLKGIVNRVFLEAIFFPGLIHLECPSLLDDAEATKAGIGLMNVGQQEIFKVTA